MRSLSIASSPKMIRCVDQRSAGLEILTDSYCREYDQIAFNRYPNYSGAFNLACALSATLEQLFKQTQCPA
jgi:hypothetical protein